MMMLKIYSNDSGRLATDQGIFHLEGRYYVEDCVISDATGEIFEIEVSVMGEDGNLSELYIE